MLSYTIFSVCFFISSIYFTFSKIFHFPLRCYVLYGLCWVQLCIWFQFIPIECVAEALERIALWCSAAGDHLRAICVHCSGSGHVVIPEWMNLAVIRGDEITILPSAIPRTSFSRYSHNNNNCLINRHVQWWTAPCNANTTLINCVAIVRYSLRSPGEWRRRHLATPCASQCPEARKNRLFGLMPCVMQKQQQQENKNKSSAKGVWMNEPAQTANNNQCLFIRVAVSNRDYSNIFTLCPDVMATWGAPVVIQRHTHIQWTVCGAGAHATSPHPYRVCATSVAIC